MAAGSAQTITYQIILEAQQAVTALAQLQQSGADFDATMSIMEEKVKETAEQFGVSWKTVLAVFKQVQSEMYAGGKGIFQPGIDAAATKTALDQMFAGVRTNLDAASGSSKSFFDNLNLVKMALGEIQSILVFQLYQAIIQVFSEGVKQANDYYQALQNITVAQDTMARQGVNVTNQQLLGMVDQMRDKWKIFSETEMTQTVSQAALLTSNLHLSADQLQRLVDMASTLAALHGGLPADYIDNLLKAASGTNALWANQMGIAITAQALLDKAKELGLVAQDYTGKLTDEQKQVAGLAVEYERLGGQGSKALQELSSDLNQQRKAQADFSDALLQIGKDFEPILTGLKEFGATAVQVFDIVLKMLWDLAGTFSAVFIVIGAGLQGQLHSLNDLKIAWTIAIDEVMKQMDRLRSGNVNLGNTAVSPTSPTAAGPEVGPTSSELDTIMKDYQTYYDGMIKAKEDFNNKMQNLQDQYNLRVQNEEQNTALHIQEEQQNFHLKMVQEEQNFQQKMKDLQNQYLLDLEDALRKRDAEAVIKIIERYNNEKTTAQQQESLKQEQMKQDEALRIKQMKEEEALRLQQMKAEYELQKKEAQQAYATQQADLARALDEKLQEEAVKIGQEHGLNQDGIVALYNLFKEYYGSDGKFASVQNDSYITMANQSQAFVDRMTAIMSQYAAMMTSTLAAAAAGINQYGGVGNVPYGPPSPADNGQYGVPGGLIGPPVPPASPQPAHPRYGTGGVSLARSATTATYGESGPELAMFLPLNASRQSQAQSLSGGLGGLMGGTATILLQLSSDLEASIIGNTLNQAALAIEKVYRSRR